MFGYKMAELCPGDAFLLKADPLRRGTIVRKADSDEFGCDLAFNFTYYVVDMHHGAAAPIQTSQGGLAEHGEVVPLDAAIQLSSDEWPFFPTHM